MWTPLQREAIERQEQEAAKKRKFLKQSRECLADLDYTTSPSTSTSGKEEKSKTMMLDEPCATGKRKETDTASLVSTMTTMNAETQTEEQSETSTASQVSTLMDAKTQTKELLPSGH